MERPQRRFLSPASIDVSVLLTLPFKYHQQEQERCTIIKEMPAEASSRPNFASDYTNSFCSIDLNDDFRRF